MSTAPNDRRDIASLLLRAVLVLLIAIFFVHWIVLARYAIDLPYMDDWLGYAWGDAGSIRPSRLFAAGNDTLMPVGRFFDAVNVRLFAGDNVIYQILTFGTRGRRLAALAIRAPEALRAVDDRACRRRSQPRADASAGHLLGRPVRRLSSGASPLGVARWTLDRRRGFDQAGREGSAHRAHHCAWRSCLCLRGLHGTRRCRIRGAVLVAARTRPAASVSRIFTGVWLGRADQSAGSALGASRGPARRHPPA